MFGKRVPNCVKREDRYLVVDKFNDPVKLFDNEEEAVSYFHANYEDLNTEASYEDLSQDQLNQIEQWYKKRKSRSIGKTQKLWRQELEFRLL